MRIETTVRPWEVVLYAPPQQAQPKQAEVREQRMVVVEPVVYVEYNKQGQAIEYHSGGRSWLC